MMEVLVVLELLEVHTVDGRTSYLNSEQIISMQPSKDHSILVEGVRCVISVADGRFISVAETCDEVREMIRRVP